MEKIGLERRGVGGERLLPVKNIGNLQKRGADGTERRQVTRMADVASVCRCRVVPVGDPGDNEGRQKRHAGKHSERAPPVLMIQTRHLWLMYRPHPVYSDVPQQNLVARPKSAKTASRLTLQPLSPKLRLINSKP